MTLTMPRRVLTLAALVSLLPAVSLAQVTKDRLVNAAQEPHNWLTYSSQRHSTLTQINLDNVDDLETKWVFQSRTSHHFQATPLVVDGIIVCDPAAERRRGARCEDGSGVLGLRARAISGRPTVLRVQ